MKKLLGVVLICTTTFAQGAKIQPPQPNYKQYGSYSRQMTVYENTQQQLDALELRKYRKFREEVNKNTVINQRIIFERRSHYHDSGFVLIRRR